MVKVKQEKKLEIMRKHLGEAVVLEPLSSRYPLHGVFVFGVYENDKFIVVPQEDVRNFKSNGTEGYYLMSAADINYPIYRKDFISFDESTKTISLDDSRQVSSWVRKLCGVVA